MPDPCARTSPLLYLLLGCSLTRNVVLLFGDRSGEASVAPESPVEKDSGRSGDAVAVAWRMGSDGFAEVSAGSLRASKLGQITSLLKDRPSHRGMDFKVPVGTEAMSTRAGVVTRANWNWVANGNCIEIRYDDGVLPKFLHLNENRVDAGDRRSTAPHLHG